MNSRQTGITEKTADRLNLDSATIDAPRKCNLKTRDWRISVRSSTRKNEFRSPVLTPPEVFGREATGNRIFKQRSLTFAPRISRSGKEVFHWKR